MSTGRPQIRARFLEYVVARISREAGVRVMRNVRLTDMDVDVSAQDERWIENLASGLNCCGGYQLAINATIRSVLSREGIPHAPCD